MTTEFERDLATAQEDLDSARHGLLAVVRPLSDADFDRARRGGWSVRRVLEHVIWSEWMYARMTGHLRDLPAQGEVELGAPDDASDTIRRLAASREALCGALEGVDEGSFYRLKTMGHEEYSIISVLENVSLHDHEHAEQVQKILGR